MSLQKWFVWLCVSGALLPVTGWAQKMPVRQIVTHALTQRPAVSLPSVLNRGVERAVLQAQHKADIRLSVARLDHAICLSSPAHLRPHATAFLFKTTYQGKPEVWAITASHNTQLGEPLRLTFHNGKKVIPVDAVVAQMGPSLLSDVALIKLEEPLPSELRPFELETKINVQEPFTTWGYSHNRLYQVRPLSFKKDNTRFIHTDFPATQKRRSGLCGGPLVTMQGKAVGVHCGASLEDKAYAASVRIIPYLLQAYHEGTAEVPFFIQDLFLGNIRIDERILEIHFMDADKQTVNILEIYDQLHQSDILRILKDPRIRFLKLLLASYQQAQPAFRVLVYDVTQRTHTYEPFNTRRSGY